MTELKVPFIDLKRLEPGLLERWQEKVKELFQAASFIGGEEVEKLESCVAEDCNTSFAISCANGTDAIQLALRASGVGPGDTVILPDFTFWATFEAVINVGAAPVTVDINSSDLHMDFDLFCKAVETYRPKAAILVHLYGWGSSRLEEFRLFCEERGIILIEDGAQSYGVLYRSESIYRSAQIATVSFYPSKIFGSVGDGGAVLTSNREIATKIRCLANHGRRGRYLHDSPGWNSRLDVLQAAYLNLAHEFLPTRIEERRKATAFYRNYFKNNAELGISCVAPSDDFEENGYVNLLLVSSTSRPSWIRSLEQEGIGHSLIYPSTVSSQKGASPYLKGKIGGETAHEISQRVLSLPLFPYILQEELERSAVALVKPSFIPSIIGPSPSV